MLYEWLLLFHILAAITWVGGGITINILSIRMMRSEDPSHIAALIRNLDWMGNRLYIPSALALLALGIWMVAISEAWTIGQLWIILGLVGIGISILIGVLYLVPEGKRIGRAVERQGPGSPEAQARFRRVFLVGRFDFTVLVLVVADMVLKPGV
jgi:uncharacterized membrane protein